MATLAVADIRAALERKGMEPSNTHHHMYRKFVDGRLSATTRVSFGERTIGDILIAQMARQCGLSIKNFKALVDCSLSEAEWDERLRTGTR